jgi:hypothetical protein
MKLALPFLIVTLSSAPLAGQEQNPAPPPPAQGPVSMEDVLAAIDKLRQTFDLADLRVREAVEIPAPAPADRERSLTAASEALNLLVQDMEALLAILPEPEDQPTPPNPGSGKPKGQKPQQPKPGEEQPQDGHKPEDSPTDGQIEQDRGQVPPPTGPPLFGQPPANYGRWGVLPPRLQEALQNSAGTEVPARYRRWLEEYHRRGQQPR